MTPSSGETVSSPEPNKRRQQSGNQFLNLLRKSFAGTKASIKYEAGTPNHVLAPRVVPLVHFPFWMSWPQFSSTCITSWSVTTAASPAEQRQKSAPERPTSCSSCKTGSRGHTSQIRGRQRQGFIGGGSVCVPTMSSQSSRTVKYFVESKSSYNRQEKKVEYRTINVHTLRVRRTCSNDASNTAESPLAPILCVQRFLDTEEARVVFSAP